MVYDRRYDERALTFEASGALTSASLVMRDRETDSWWSIMAGMAIGGDLEGRSLIELPVGEKTTWGAWRRAHPESLVLSVGGVEHLRANPYDGYFATDETFRDLPRTDDRLAAKEPIFAFRYTEQAFAVSHQRLEGGMLVSLPDGRRALLHRRPEAPLFESTRAWILTGSHPVSSDDPETVFSALVSGDRAGEPLAGFDTYWYTWAGVNGDTRLLE